MRVGGKMRRGKCGASLEKRGDRRYDNNPEV